MTRRWNGAWWGEEDEWCPENDGAYRAEMAAIYGSLKGRQTFLEKEFQDALKDIEDLYEED